MIEYNKVNRNENKEKLSEYNKVYRNENKEKILEYKKPYQKQYQHQNKEKIEAKRSVKVTCECGCSIRKSSISTHRKTQKHINLMSQIEQSL